MVVMTVITAVRAVAHVVANRSAQYCTGNRQQCAAITTAKLVADESADNTTDDAADIITACQNLAHKITNLKTDANKKTSKKQTIHITIDKDMEIARPMKVPGSDPPTQAWLLTKAP